MENKIIYNGSAKNTLDIMNYIGFTKGVNNCSADGCGLLIHDVFFPIGSEFTRNYDNLIRGDNKVKQIIYHIDFEKCEPIVDYKEFNNLKNKTMKDLPLIINTELKTIQLLKNVSLKDLVEYCTAHTIDLETYKLLATKIELKFPVNKNPILGGQSYRVAPDNPFDNRPNILGTNSIYMDIRNKNTSTT